MNEFTKLVQLMLTSVLEHTMQTLLVGFQADNATFLALLSPILERQSADSPVNPSIINLSSDAKHAWLLLYDLVQEESQLKANKILLEDIRKASVTYGISEKFFLLQVKTHVKIFIVDYYNQLQQFPTLPERPVEASVPTNTTSISLLQNKPEVEETIVPNNSPGLTSNQVKHKANKRAKTASSPTISPITPNLTLPLPAVSDKPSLTKPSFSIISDSHLQARDKQTSSPASDTSKNQLPLKEDNRLCPDKLPSLEPVLPLLDLNASPEANYQPESWSERSRQTTSAKNYLLNTAFSQETYSPLNNERNTPYFFKPPPNYRHPVLSPFLLQSTDQNSLYLPTVMPAHIFEYFIEQAAYCYNRQAYQTALDINEHASQYAPPMSHEQYLVLMSQRSHILKALSMTYLKQAKACDAFIEQHSSKPSSYKR